MTAQTFRPDTKRTFQDIRCLHKTRFAEAAVRPFAWLTLAVASLLPARQCTAAPYVRRRRNSRCIPRTLQGSAQHLRCSRSWALAGCTTSTKAAGAYRPATPPSCTARLPLSGAWPARHKYSLEAGVLAGSTTAKLKFSCLRRLHRMGCASPTLTAFLSNLST